MNDYYKRKKKIIAVVGTGTAGYLTALLLSKYLEDNFIIYLIGDFNINNTIGVGEATTLGIHKVFKDMNISFSDLILSGVTFKYGIIFEGWNRKFYLHPFYNYTNEILLSFFYKRYIDTKGIVSFSEYLYNISKFLKGYVWTDYKLFPYAYHLDLKNIYNLFIYKLNRLKNVILLKDRVISYRLDHRGYITKLILSSGNKIDIDFLIDCTGFKSRFISSFNFNNFVKFNDLLNDTVVAFKVSYDKVGLSMNPYTLSKAMKCGWLWFIPLQKYISVGYVYSSLFCKEIDIIDELRKLFGISNWDEFLKSVNIYNIIHFKSGHYKYGWINNVLSIGLSYGFIEPLESTGLWLIYSMIYLFIKFYNNGNFIDKDIKKYNYLINKSLDNIKDFIVFHYLLTNRKEKFWLASKSVIKSDYLKEILIKKDDKYILNLDSLRFEDFDIKGLEYFSPISYLFIYVGNLNCFHVNVSKEKYLNKLVGYYRNIYNYHVYKSKKIIRYDKFFKRLISKYLPL